MIYRLRLASKKVEEDRRYQEECKRQDELRRLPIIPLLTKENQKIQEESPKTVEEVLEEEIVKNTKAGIFGICDDEVMEQCICESMPIALKQEIEEGSATIICSVTGVPKEYSVTIDEVRMDSENVNRGIVLTVTDQKLLNVTGGIVQGMSGSPIIQNGKIVGAVTHVFVNDPTKGYGVLIETMLAQ